MTVLIGRAAHRAPQLDAVHMLRHSFCSHLGNEGGAAAGDSGAGWHKDLSTTQRYKHLSPAATINAIRLLDEGKTAGNFGDMLESVPCKVSSRSRWKSGLRRCRYT